MLTKGDDFPLHQTPEPVAYAGTDRNFYDRYFFNGYAPDGSGFFAVAFGIYPHLNVCDAHFSAIRDGVQFNLHASRELGMERMDLACGRSGSRWSHR
jgi:sarcosine oxidase delta subunit